MGSQEVSDDRPAFYAPTGSRRGDLVSLLHVPYTLWHLSYVAIGAALSQQFDWVRLTGTLLAFAVGLGIGAHAFDEVHSRPLGTALTSASLWTLGLAAMAVSLAIAAVGAVVVSPWVAVWGVLGVLLAMGYSLEWSRLIHNDVGFALAWGAFPVLTGYWAQAESISAPALAVAAAATLLSLAQRALSTPARFVRRRTEMAEVIFDADRRWDRAHLLRTWERPLRLLTWTIVALGLGLLLGRL